MKKLLKNFLVCAVFMFFIFNADCAAASSSLRYNDINGHWAREVIERWTDRDIITGDGGQFRPNDMVTRAEFAAIINRVMKYPSVAVPQVRFQDVAPGAWYATDIYKLYGFKVMIGVDVAVQGGLMSSTATFMFPESGITREEAAVVMARAFKLPPSSREPRFADAGKISFWARESCSAMVDYGYLNSNSSYFRPQDLITRAEVVQMLDNIISEIYKYGTTSYLQDVSGNMVINQPSTTLRNARIRGNLYITEGVTGSEIILDRISVDGEIIVIGKPNVTVNNCTTSAVNIQGGGIVTIDGKYNNIITNAESNVVLYFGGTASNVNINSKTTFVNRGEVKRLYTNAESIVQATDGSIIENLYLNFKTSVMGTGSIDYAKINVSGCSFQTAPGHYEILPGATVTMPGSSNSTNPWPTVTPSPSTNGFSRGNGTKDNPYVIETASQFLLLNTTDTNGKYFKLARSISLGNNEHITSNFAGYFDGGGNTVTVNISSSNADAVGLFNSMNTNGFGVIANLNVDGQVNALGRNYVGGVVGMVNKSTVTNCTSSVSVLGARNVGGIAGYASQAAVISQSSSFNNVRGDANVGGIAGSVSVSSVVENCYNAAFVSADADAAGGICGTAENNTKINQCYNTNIVISPNQYGPIVAAVVGTQVNNVVSSCLYDSSMFTAAGNIAYGNGYNGPLVDKSLFAGFGNIWKMGYGNLYYQAVLANNNVFPVTFSGGDGTVQNPYLISDARQFIALSFIETNDKFFKLINDISLPVNFYIARAFGGYLDGNYKSVNVNIQRAPQNANVALFSEISQKGALNNLLVSGRNTSGVQNAGGLFGINRGTVANCTNSVALN